MPFPMPLMTPPVTNTYFLLFDDDDDDDDDDDELPFLLFTVETLGLVIFLFLFEGVEDAADADAVPWAYNLWADSDDDDCDGDDGDGDDDVCHVSCILLLIARFPRRYA